MTVTVPTSNTDSVVTNALAIAADGVNDINTLLSDIAGTSPANEIDTAAGKAVITEYTNMAAPPSVKITDAAGAMIIDDLMQKISTKVQVAAQLLSTANSIAKRTQQISAQG